MRITEFDSTLLIPAELGADALATDFGEVVNSNPEILLEISKRLVKKDKVQGNTQSRAEREEKDRVRHAMGLARIIQEAALPVSLRIDSLEKPDIGWQRAFGSRRAKTLRIRVWNKFRAWLNASYGAVWPKTSIVIINYVEELIQLECCPISLPRELVASLSLLEQVGMVPETMRLSNDSLLVSHLKSWDSMLRSGEAPRGPARPYTVAVLVALELYIFDKDQDYFYRVIAWVMLMATWTSMRVDDIQRVQPASVRLSNRGLTLRLSRTKTIGPGKLHGTLHAFVGRHITLTGLDWLEFGVDALKREDMNFPRDYLIPGPNKDRDGFRPKILEPPELANYFRMVLGFLQPPRKHGDEWEKVENARLNPETTIMFWTGHSPRHFAVQVAAALGILKEKRDYLGRWSIGRVGSNAYLHTSRQVVESIQQEILGALQSPTVPYDESELLDDLQEFANNAGLVGYRISRRHRVLPLLDNQGLVSIQEDTDDEVLEESVIEHAVETSVEENLAVTREQQIDQERFFVTVSRRDGFRRLHLTGACPVQSWRCQEIEMIQDPQKSNFDAVCLHCKRKLQAQLGKEEENNDSDTDGESSSTSSSSEETGHQIREVAERVCCAFNLGFEL